MRTAWKLAAALLLALPACSERAGKDDPAGPSFNAAARDTSTGASHYTANGRFAVVNWFNGMPGDSNGPPGSFEQGVLQAQTVGGVNNAMVYVSWYVFRCDAFGCAVAEGGDGLVPVSVLSGNDRRMSLAFNPADHPGVFVFAGGGPVRAEWSSDGQFRQTNSGVQTIDTPWFSQRQQGRQVSSSAFAAGSIGGTAIPPGSFGQIGTNHAVSLVFQRR